MGVLTSKHERCASGHDHKTIEDAYECDRYFSKRLQENDTLRQVDNVFGDSPGHRYQPYPQNRPQYGGRHTNGSDVFDEQAYTGPDPRRNAGQERTNGNIHRNTGSCSGSNNSPGRHNDTHHGNNNKPKHKKQDSQEKPDTTEKPGFLSRVFSRDVYYCAEHHSHTTVGEMYDCNRKKEERAKELHRQQMEEKFQRGGIKRQVERPDEHQPRGPVIEELD